MDGAPGGMIAGLLAALAVAACAASPRRRRRRPKGGGTLSLRSVLPDRSLATWNGPVVRYAIDAKVVHFARSACCDLPNHLYDERVVGRSPDDYPDW